MPSRNYWLDLFTGTTWQEFLDAGAKVSGFRESCWTTVQKIRKGDYLEAQASPQVRPVDPAKLGRRPKTLAAKLGPVTVPETEEPADDKPAPSKEPREHTEIHWFEAHRIGRKDFKIKKVLR